MLSFPEERCQTEALSLDGRTIEYRSFKDLVYVEKPVDEEYQRMNLFVPELYYHDGEINGYTARTVPIFMPNTVGGYMPGGLEEPGPSRFRPDSPNTVFEALAHGYVVAVPAVRGRSLHNEEGINTGKAPAFIIDMKAAVRYLRHFAGRFPGDTEKIITNGTSAGGALSSLAGACGNHPDYLPYLMEIGAADERDDIYAASCYCPITNLEHADMAYEWQFCGVYTYRRTHMVMGEGGRPAFEPVDGQMTGQEIKVSKEEAQLFPAYINSLGLKDETGAALELSADGNGSFKRYVEKQVLASAQQALKQGTDLSETAWLMLEDGRAVSMDFAAYAADITRMKNAPAFDALDLSSPENDVFGTKRKKADHFTEYSLKNTTAGGGIADPQIVRMMNPMPYIADKAADTAKHWRIRHGSCDRDTSLAISALLTLTLRQQGCQVDYHIPWGLPHSGDYDLVELFAWIDGIC